MRFISVTCKIAVYLAAVLAFSATATFGQDQQVVWTSLVNAAANGAGLTRISTASEGGAISTQSMTDGNIKMVFSGVNDGGYVGLSSTDTDANFNTIRYCFYVKGKMWKIYENGVLKAESKKDENPSKSTVYSIRKEKASIDYMVGNTNVFTSSVGMYQLLFVDVSMTGTSVATIPPVTINGRTFSNAPSSLTAQAVNETSINLTWTDNSSNETGFQIERSLSSSSGFTLVTTVAANGRTYSDNALTPETTYYYRVRAILPSEMSNYSSVVNAMTAGRTNWLENSTAVYLVANNVGIGTSNPDTKLTVNGSIHAQEARIDLSVPGPDYVFHEDYALRSLDSLQAFISENSHLPEVPSAAEMESDGVEIGQMNMLLLKKIEELTLYIIEQDKRIKALEQERKNLSTERQ